jgi:hypothetical protein
MGKIQIPSEAVEIGGSLNTFYFDKAMLRSDVVKTNDGETATAEDNFDLTIGEVGSILAAGGEVLEHLMAVRAPIVFFTQLVPIDLPNSQKYDGSGDLTNRSFSDWFNTGAEIWIKDDKTEMLFYTNPFAGNSSSYLKGSEVSIINDISGSVQIKTITEAEAITVTGWTKI